MERGENVLTRQRPHGFSKSISLPPFADRVDGSRSIFWAWGEDSAPRSLILNGCRLPGKTQRSPHSTNSATFWSTSPGCWKNWTPFERIPLPNAARTPEPTCWRSAFASSNI